MYTLLATVRYSIVVWFVPNFSQYLLLVGFCRADLVFAQFGRVIDLPPFIHTVNRHDIEHFAFVVTHVGKNNNTQLVEALGDDYDIRMLAHLIVVRCESQHILLHFAFRL